MTIKNYSTTDTNNNGAVPNGAPDGMLPSDVIDVFRRHMADHRTQWNDAQWFEFLDGTPDGVASYVSSNQFKITGSDVSSHYHIGRRIKVVGSSTIYGSITTVSYGSGATTITIDASLTNESISVFSSVLSADNDALPREVIENIVGAMLSGNTTSDIDVTYQDGDGTIDFEVTATDENFTTAFKDKLDAIAAEANNYSHPTGDGNKHIPAGGTVGQFLKSDGDETNSWIDPAFVPTTGNSNIQGIKTFTSTTQANNKDTGAVIIQGGLGVEKNIYAGGEVGGANSSDKRLKKNISQFHDPLIMVRHMSGCEFMYENPENERQEGQQYGLIAQEVQAILPELISENEDGFLSIKTGGHELIALLVASINALNEKLERNGIK